MSTAFVDPVDHRDEISEKTTLEGGAAGSASVEKDLACIHTAGCGSSDEGGYDLVELDAATGNTLAAQLKKLHGTLTSPTRGTVILRFFEVALADTLNEIFTVRARSVENWGSESGRFHVTTTRISPPSRAWRTFEELSRWIGIGKVRTAKMLGISRGTTNAWKAGGEPQPANARRLYRSHTIVKTLVRRLGFEETRAWLETGDPSPLDLLAAGDLAAVDRAASALVFVGSEQESERVGAFIPESDDVESVEERPSKVVAPPKRVRRAAARRRTR